MRRPTPRGAAVGAATLSLMLVAACGSGSGSDGADGGGSADQAAAKAAVEKAKAVPEFVAPGPAFDASAARGKRIALVPDYPMLPFVQEINVGLKAAAKEAGLEVDDCNNDGTVGGWVKCFDKAIASKPDLIVLNGSPSPSQLQPQIKAAKAAGIPVIANHVPLDEEFPKGTLPETNVTGLTAVQPGPFVQGAKLMADYTVAEDGADVNALIVTANEAPASRGLVKMIQDELAAVCDSCENTVLNVPIVDWATKLQGEVRTALLKDPEINWIITIYDGAMPNVVPAIQAAGRKGKVKLTGFNGQGFALQGIADGTVTSTMGENLEWTGWATIDRALRVLVNGDADDATEIDTPVRVWDSSNIDEAGTPPKPTQGYGDTFKDGYLELWGVK